MLWRSLLLRERCCEFAGQRNTYNLLGWSNSTKRPLMLKLELVEDMRLFAKIVEGLLVAGALLCLLALTGAGVQAHDEPARHAQEHLLRLYNTHTGERLEIVFRRGEEYVPGAL